MPITWFDRDRRRFAHYRRPAEQLARDTRAEQIGTDGRDLRQHRYRRDAPSGLRDLAAVQVVRHVWLPQCAAVADDQGIRWRTAEDLPPAPIRISSPYDPDARDGKQRRTEWTGDTVHLSETCDVDTPHLITDVLTTPATTSDFDVLPSIQQQLAARDLVPSEHIVDSGYPTADHLVTSRERYASAVIGPLATDHRWQAKANEGCAAAQFVIDWDHEYATCPQGNTRVPWLLRPDEHERMRIQITCAKADGMACPMRAQCTPSKTQPRRLQVRDQAHDEVLQTARQRQQTDVYKAHYAARAGIEGTISQGVQIGDLRRSRYRGLPKTRLLHLLIAAALNFIRVAAWLAETPRARTRQSAFAHLCPL